MIISLKKQSELTSHYTNILNYIDEKINDIKSTINDNNLKYQYIITKISEVNNMVSDINKKVPEDIVDRLLALGKSEDFDAGLVDGLNGEEYGKSFSG